MQRHHILLLTGLLAAATPLAAQTVGSGSTLDARMQAFLREVADEPNTELAAFFPRRGDWTSVRTRRDWHGRRGGTSVWRFPGAETVRAIGEGGPICDSFHTGDGHSGPMAGRLADYAEPDDGRWRRVRGNRYVPLGASAGSSVFVEWRREDGEWVVSAVGDESMDFSPRLLGTEVGRASRDTALVPEGAAYAAGQDWYEERRVINIGGRRYFLYGRPRTIDRANLQRVDVLGRVSVYARGSGRELLYVPISPGQYQAYETHSPAPCR